jgi:hypothetical protein
MTKNFSKSLTRSATSAAVEGECVDKGPWSSGAMRRPVPSRGFRAAAAEVDRRAPLRVDDAPYPHDSRKTRIRRGTVTYVVMVQLTIPHSRESPSVSGIKQILCRAGGHLITSQSIGPRAVRGRAAVAQEHLLRQSRTSDLASTCVRQRAPAAFGVYPAMLKVEG